MQFEKYKYNELRLHLLRRMFYTAHCVFIIKFDRFCYEIYFMIIYLQIRCSNNEKQCEICGRTQRALGENKILRS